MDNNIYYERDIERGLVLDGTKIIWHRERVEAWLRGERIAPITIDCALTRACNYRCIYCYSALQENLGYPLKRDVIFRFLDDAVDIGVKAISLVSDGESTCSPYFYDTVYHARENGLDVAVGTNGILLKKEELTSLLKALTYLRFNISAGEPHRYAQIMGTREENFYKLCDIIKECVRIKRENRLEVTLGMQMVLMLNFIDQVIPLAKLGKELGVDYLVIKHCSDDEFGSLGVNYEGYARYKDILKEAEEYSDDNYLVKVKWSKIEAGRKRIYTQCYGPPFIMQLSGSGLVAPCGMLFNERYKKFHIGNIAEQSFRKLWQGKRYWEVMDYLASPKFNAQTDCGYLCLQHKVNEFLWLLKKGGVRLEDIKMRDKPQHINFI